jgi:hypothetical protein
MTKPKKKPAKAKPSLTALLENALIKDMHRELPPLGPNFSQLDHALIERSGTDLSGLIDDIFKDCIVFDTRFLLRAQWLAATPCHSKRNR